MDVLLALLGLVSLITIAVGLFKPSLVVRWGKKKTRPRVLMIYGGLFIVLLVALGMTGDASSKENNSSPVVEAAESQKVEQVKHYGNKPSKKAASKEPVKKYAQSGARKLIEDWVGEHEFPNSPLSLNAGTADGSLYKVDGKKYHMFTLTGLNRAVDILVDPYTGKLFFHDIGLKPKSLDKWYVEYRTSHRAEFGKKINENFEWVEKPSVQNGAVVGKVKNISNTTYKNAFIEFNVSDASKNRIGTLNSQIRNLKPGDVWSFTLLIYQPNAALYEFEKVEGYTW